MNNDNTDIQFTGECFVPGRADKRMEDDHMERYHFASQFTQGKNILDIACGVGYASAILMKSGALSYQGVDISNKNIAFAKKKYGCESVNYSVGNICSYNCNETYDLITCFETIEHVPEYVGALRNLYTLLKPSGKLLISSPNRIVTSPKAKLLLDTPANEYHTQEFTPEELKSSLQDAGFIMHSDTIYGQRLGRYHSTKIAERIDHMIFGNPKKKASAKVVEINNKVPRYFVLIAEK